MSVFSAVFPAAVVVVVLVSACGDPSSTELSDATPNAFEIMDKRVIDLLESPVFEVTLRKDNDPNALFSWRRNEGLMRWDVVSELERKPQGLASVFAEGGSTELDVNCDWLQRTPRQDDFSVACFQAAQPADPIGSAMEDALQRRLVASLGVRRIDGDFADCYSFEQISRPGEICVDSTSRVPVLLSVTTAIGATYELVASSAESTTQLFTTLEHFPRVTSIAESGSASASDLQFALALREVLGIK